MGNIVEKFHRVEVEGKLNFLIGMNEHEWMATTHALDLGILAEWRKKVAH